MTAKPVAAGKSSFDLIAPEPAFEQIITPSARTYLDLACGAGRYSLALAERLGPGATIHALDLWEDGVAALNATAAELGLAIRAQVADATRPLPLPDASVDVCLMATALHDLPEAAHADVIGEIRRVLTPGGAFALIEFKRLDHGPGPGIAKRIGEREADVLLLPHGFAKAACVELGEFTYLGRYTKA